MNHAPIDLHNADTFAAGIPHDAFAQMRAASGLTWTEPGPGDRSGFWSVTRHQDLVTVSRDTATYSSEVGHIQIYDIDEDALDARASMIDLDPPMHTRLRRLVSSAFTPRHVALAAGTEAQSIGQAFSEAGEIARIGSIKIHANNLPSGITHDLDEEPLFRQEQRWRVKHGLPFFRADLIERSAIEIVEPQMRGCEVIVRIEWFARSIATRFHAKKDHSPAIRKEGSRLPSHLIRQIEIKVV